MLLYHFFFHASFRVYDDVKPRENDNVMLSRANILWRCKRKKTESLKGAGVCDDIF